MTFLVLWIVVGIYPVFITNIFRNTDIYILMILMEIHVLTEYHGFSLHPCISMQNFLIVEIQNSYVFWPIINCTKTKQNSYNTNANRQVLIVPT